MALTEFTSGGARDFRQRYLGVFGFFPKENGQDVLVRMTDINENKSIFEDKEGVTYTAYANRGVFFKFVPIERKLFMHKGKVCLAQRRVARQYSRGINEVNTAFTYLSGYDTCSVSFDTVHSYTQPIPEQKLNPEQYILSPMFSIVNTHLYVYDRRIGVYSHVRDVLTVSNDLFIQEVKDAVARRGLATKVE